MIFVVPLVSADPVSEDTDNFNISISNNTTDSETNDSEKASTLIALFTLYAFVKIASAMFVMNKEENCFKVACIECYFAWDIFRCIGSQVSAGIKSVGTCIDGGFGSNRVGDLHNVELADNFDDLENPPPIDPRLIPPPPIDPPIYVLREAFPIEVSPRYRPPSPTNSYSSLAPSYRLTPPSPTPSTRSNPPPY
ncbi:hypothetical protein DID78_04585 [Candidatus Marinamargulisbacteria bacterium SCGC AG-343-D04]|nr:hypothetical protein DID78_04585 [Candidatus Marinamargulisbacteria bacterium SCGC AG-343-D04]